MSGQVYYKCGLCFVCCIVLTSTMILRYCSNRICARVLAWQAHLVFCPATGQAGPVIDMKIKNSLKALKARHRDNRMVRRKGRIYIINKTAPRFKARQG